MFDVDAVLFDLDGTLVRVDTSSEYARYERRLGRGSRWQPLRVAYWLLLHRLGRLDLRSAVERGYRSWIGATEAAATAAGLDWFENSDVRTHISGSARATVQQHQGRGAFVAMITGQTPFLATPIADDLGIEEVVGTRLETREGRFTGRVVAPVSYGDGKLRLAEELAQQRGFALERTAFYADSTSDLPLLERVGRPVAVNPDRRLRRIAEQRSWPMLSW